MKRGRFILGKSSKNQRFLFIRPGLAKRGQYYLVSVLILSAIVISIVAITNYSKKNEYLDLNSLGGELQIESANVLDYGLNSRLTQQGMNQKMTDFSQRYIDTESRDKNLYFVFGNQGNTTLKGYQNAIHKVSLDSTVVTSSSGAFIGSIDPVGNSVTLGVDEDSYIFTLKGGENFFFVISRETGGENYVVTG